MSDDAIAEYAIGESRPAPLVEVRRLDAFDPSQTIISQYANSPVLCALITSFSEMIDPTAKIDDFFRLVFDLNTAQGYGLDVWGRIVGVSRVLNLPVAGEYLGFSQASDAEPFGQAPFFNRQTLTTNFALSDTAFRRLIFAKALANISDGSIPSINRILTLLFGQYGNCYVTDGGDMTMTFTFGSDLAPVDLAIVSQSGILPKPVGVSSTIVQL